MWRAIVRYCSDIFVYTLIHRRARCSPNGGGGQEIRKNEIFSGGGQRFHWPRMVRFLNLNLINRIHFEYRNIHLRELNIEYPYI